MNRPARNHCFLILAGAMALQALPMKVGIPSNWPSSLIDPRLVAFGLYATELIQLNNGAAVSAYRVGSGGDIQLGVLSLLEGYAFARGNVRAFNYAGIAGDIRFGGRFEAAPTARLFGRPIPDTSLAQQPTLAWIESSFPVVGSPVVIEAGQTQLLEPSSAMPTDVTVRSGGTLVLRGNRSQSYDFRRLVFNSGAKVRIEAQAGLSTTIPYVIRVRGEFLVDNVVMTGVGVDGRAVLWMIDGAQEIHLNGGTRFLGAIAAPKSKVTVASLAGIEGCIWARAIEIHQYNTYLRFVPFTGNSSVADLDEDGLDDTLEMRLGTDPLLTDTDGDGYSDGLEVRGRQGFLGAAKSITAYGQGFYHTWRWALDSTRRDLMNPLRRDQFVRLVWQDSTDISLGRSVADSVWDPSMKACRAEGRYGDVFTANFDKVWRDSAYLDRLVEIFADPSDKPLVDAPHIARVPDYTVTLHLDLGGPGNRNIEAGLPVFGGGVLVASGGRDTLGGPYSFDRDGDGRISNSGSLSDTACNGVSRITTRTNEKDSLLQRLFRGWTPDPFRDIWMIGIGVASFAKPLEPSGIARPHFLVSLQGAGNTFSFVQILLHEYGHTVGLGHHRQLDGSGPSGIALLYDGAMNYAFSGTARIQRCAPFRGMTWSDTRWCGEDPPGSVDGVFRNWSNPLSAWFNLGWWRNEYTPGIGAEANQPTGFGDTILFEGGGPIDRRTGFRKPIWRLVPHDLGFSSGAYCSVSLATMVESAGISRCRDRHGSVLAVPEPGTPIDWNQNGMIDPAPVDLSMNQPGWFMRLNGLGDPVSKAFSTSIQQDDPDWNIMLLGKWAFGQDASLVDPRRVMIQSQGRSIQGEFKW